MMYAPPLGVSMLLLWITLQVTPVIGLVLHAPTTQQNLHENLLKTPANRLALRHKHSWLYEGISILRDEHRKKEPMDPNTVAYRFVNVSNM